MTIVARQLNAAEIAAARAQAALITNSANRLVGPGQFIYFVAFDGTNNDRDALWKANAAQRTNVAELEALVAEANPKGSSVASGYFPGPGTGGNFDPSAVFPTAAIIEIAERAYLDFSRKGSEWISLNPAAEVSTALTSFSRGGAAAAVFSQLVYERGLVSPDTGEVLIAPGHVGFSAGAVLDPVFTGVNLNVAFAPNVRNLAVVRSLHEFRNLFDPPEYSDHPGITTVLMTGNHTDVGGGYDNGLGALTLEASAAMFRRVGINVSDVLPGRRFSEEQAVIHDEAFDRILNFDTGELETRRIWNSYGSVVEGTVRRVDTSRTILNETTTFNADGSVVSTFTNYRGQLVVTSRWTGPDGSREVQTQLKYPDGQVATETRQRISADGNTVTINSSDGAGGWRQRSTVRAPGEDGSFVLTIRRSDGSVQVAAYNTDSRLVASDVTTLAPSGGELTIRSEPVNGVLTETYRTTTSFDDEGGRTMFRQYADGRRETSVYDADGILFNREWTTPLGTQAVRYDTSGRPVRTVVTQGDDDGNTLVVTSHADGSGSVLALDSAGTRVSESTFQRTDDAGTASIDGRHLTITSGVAGRAVAVEAQVRGDAGDGDFAGAVDVRGISSVDGTLVLDGGELTQADLNAFGLTFSDLARGTLPAAVNALVGGMDPTAVLGSGWAPPTVVEQPIPQGFERRIDLPNGFTLTSTYDSDRRLIEVTETEARNSTTALSQTWAINADGSRTLRSTSSRSVGMDGSYVGTEHDLQAREIYRVVGDADGNTTRRIDPTLTSDLRQSQTATVFSDVSGLVSAIRAGDAIPALASGVRLVNNLSIAQGAENANLASASTVAAGVLSFYNLYNAFNQGNDFDRVNAALTSLNYANQAFSVLGGAGGAVSNFLNGTGLASGSVGVLPALGLVAAIRAKDPIGMAMSVGTMISGAPFLTTPVGLILIGASILRTMFDDGPPDAWGVARVTFGEGFQTRVEAEGENFGPDQARTRLQSVVDVMGDIIARNNQADPDSTRHLGLIPQRMPQITYRASEFRDLGFAVHDVDALTGAQRLPFLRFGEDGQPFGVTPGEMTAAERALLRLEGAPGADPLVAYMLNSALQRGAIAPLWEVQTARLQQQAGDPNAGLTEEERAAKAGWAARLDAACAAAHRDDPQAANRRQGRFMVVGLDMSGDGRIGARTIAQNAAQGRAISFDWDGQGYQKPTGWIGAEDGFLVLDHDFNQSVDSAKELMSNPLVADAGKGLRLLAAYDANGDGRIDARDPVYHQLRVWQDLDQDGNNTRLLGVGPAQQRVGDESQGQRELRTLAEAGITAIDYANGRFELGAGQWRQIATTTLEAQDEGVRYTPVGAGIRIDATNGPPQIVITQVQNEAAARQALQVTASGETIGTPDAPLYEDGMPTSYNPNTAGGPVEIIIHAAQLLANDTWDQFTGPPLLAITSVRSGAHTQASLRTDGNISLRLEANYHGPADFFYTVDLALADPENIVTPREARVGLNITSVNDAPTAVNREAAPRAIYGYEPFSYTWGRLTGRGEDDLDLQERRGVVAGQPIYHTYLEQVPAQPIYELRWVAVNDEVEQRPVLVDIRPAYEIPRLTPVATDRPNAGTISVEDVDGASGFSFEVVTQPLFGRATVDGSGNWNYVGLRPEAFLIEDVSGDGLRDWVYRDGSAGVENAWAVLPGPNRLENGYLGNEPAPFPDYFTIRVYDRSDPTRRTFHDVQVEATHYGPPPVPEVSDSGGSPIVVDLDGDGFAFTDLDASNVFYDITGDGWRRRIAWPEAGDGLLAIDRDGNGLIERADEISFVPYAREAQTDLGALRAAFDTDGNGRLDAADGQWARFGVWRDANANGVTDAGEFRRLDEMGITAIDLWSDERFRVIDGQTVHGIGTATRADGSTLAIADVTLRYRNETRARQADGSAAATGTVAVATQSAGQAIRGTAQGDMAFGTLGSDSFAMGDGNDVVVDDAGNDHVDGGDGDDHLFTGADNDLVVGGAGHDVVFAGPGNDLVFGDGAAESGDDVLMLEDGHDVAFGGDGDDFIAGGAGNDVLSGNRGNDRLFGEDGWDALFGQEGDDELRGMAGNDLLVAGEGDDLLDGGEGDDRMEGGAGDDRYVVDSLADQVVEEADGGVDTVESSISHALAGNLENLSLLSDGPLDGTGNEAANRLVGNDRANTLRGLGGDDLLDGGRGADRMEGGAGNDVYVVDHAGDRVVEAAGEGRDTVRSRITLTLADEVEDLVLLGLAAIDGRGNALANVLVGNGAANVLDGGLGADTLRGGGGNDAYHVDDAGDVVIELAGEGRDAVFASVSHVLAANVEDLTLAGAAPIDATGNELANVLNGNAAANVIDGGAGADLMAGGGGDDRYVVDDVRDVVVEREGEGEDTVFSSVDHELAAAVENLLLTGEALMGIGNAQANRLRGNALANLLDGRAGADWMAGGAGDDTYVVDDVQDAVVEQAGEGRDTVVSSVSFVLPAHVEIIRLAGSADLDGTGNPLDNAVFGNAGMNRLDGAAGADLMAGGAGNDSYVVDDAGDVVVEQAGEGQDRVFASVSHRLASNVEELVLTGAAAIDATGNELANDLAGNAAANALDGGRGGDRMAGGGGDDVYVVDDAHDVVVERDGEGDDTVRASVDHELAAAVERLVLTGAAVTGRGNALDNTLTGNTFGNLLDGGAGADAMAGGAGDDSYVVDDAGDVVSEQANEGVDTIFASVSVVLPDQVETLQLWGEADLDATGNALDNVLQGNRGANVLDGGAGGDAMAGGGGDDTYVVDDARDVVLEWFGRGRDRIFAGVDYVLPAHVEALHLTGRAMAGTGNEAANTLTGNSLDNRLDGGAGADWMAGGSGDDGYLVDDEADTVVERDGEGTDEVISSVSHSLAQAVENLSLTGSAALDATGNASANRLAGNAGDNRLDGRGGADVMLGGGGDDTYVVDDEGDRVIELAGEGRDTVLTSIDYVLPAHVEALVLGAGAMQGTGNALANHLTGNAAANRLDGGAGADTLAGGDGDDRYVVDHALDRVVERPGEGRDTVFASVDHVLPEHVEDLVLTSEASISATGNGLDNALYGNRGNNLLAGGAGDDTYHYSSGGGLDTIVDTSGHDTVRFGPGLTLDDIALRVVVRDGRTLAQVRVVDAAGQRIEGQGIDFEMGSDARMRLRSPIERFVFADGSSHGWDALQVQSTPLVGTAGADLLVAGRGSDRVDGGAGNDALYGGAGHDSLYGADGCDVLYGASGNDRLFGGHDADELYGQAGDDALYGENGDDYLFDQLGDNVLVGGNHRDVAQAGGGADRIDLGNHEDLADAGAGNDVISVGNGDDWVAAGRGNDVIDLGNGRNLLAFNRGDGADVVTGGSKDVLSIGGGIRYRDISLARSGADLLLRLGGSDSVTLRDWYARGKSNQSVDRLQVVTVGGDHDPGSRDALRDDRVEVFDFARLVQGFDRARSANASHANGWSVMNSLLDAHLAGSDRAALGGDLSFQYHTSGGLSGMNLDAALHGLSQGSTDWQELRPRAELERGSSVRLA